MTRQGKPRPDSDRARGRPEAQPVPTAPRIPEAYGVPTDGSGGERLPWSWAVERLAAARNYWVCTSRPDGRPHAVPVWGLWLDDAVWFSTARLSQKARNLAAGPALVVHLESGDETVILEGEAEEVLDGSALSRFADAYDAKYAIRPDLGDERNVVYAVRPRVAHTWDERDYPRTAARWIFDEPESTETPGRQTETRGRPNSTAR